MTDAEADVIQVTAITPPATAPTGINAPAIPTIGHPITLAWTGTADASILTFGVKGGYDAGVKLVSSAELFSHLANLGDTRSLIIHPASTTHSQLSEGELVAAGAGPDVVRVSVGIEHIDDIIADISQGLDQV